MLSIMTMRQISTGLLLAGLQVALLMLALAESQSVDVFADDTARLRLLVGLMFVLAALASIRLVILCWRLLRTGTVRWLDVLLSAATAVLLPLALWLLIPTVTWILIVPFLL